MFTLRDTEHEWRCDGGGGRYFSIGNLGLLYHFVRDLTIAGNGWTKQQGKSIYGT